MMSAILKLIFLPLYLFMFIVQFLAGTVIYTGMFFFLGPVAPFAGIMCGLSWAVETTSGKKKRSRKRR